MPNEWRTWDELNFIRRLAEGNSFLRDHRFRHNPRLAVRRYARLVLAGGRTYDPGIDFGQIYSALKKVLKQSCEENGPNNSGNWPGKISTAKPGASRGLKTVA